MRKLFILFLLITLPLVALADVVEIDGIYYDLNTQDKTAEVTNNTNKHPGEIVIPASVTYNHIEYQVTSIKSSAFSDTYPTSISVSDDNQTLYSPIKNVITSKDGKTAYFVFRAAFIPHGVTSIADNALNDCQKVYLPTTITYIGNQYPEHNLEMYLTSEFPPETSATFSFSTCIVPKEYYDNYKSNVVFKPYNYKTHIIPTGYEVIGEPSIGDDACIAFFNPQTKMATLVAYTVRDSDVDSGGFINLPAQINYTKTESCPLEEYNIQFLYSGGNSQIESLQKLRISEGVRKIKSIRLGNSNTISGIKEINLPSTLEQCNPFSGIWPLEKISVNSGNPVFDSRENCNALVKTATNTIVMGCSKTSILPSIEHIGERAFESVKNLPDILSIPANIKTIGKKAFSYTYGKKVDEYNYNQFQLEFASSSQMTIIEDSTFWYAGVSHVALPNSIVTIKDGAFSDCTFLSGVSLGISLKEIEQNAFENCALTSLTLPDALETIGEFAFSKNTNLETINFGKSQKTIGFHAFFRTGIISLALPIGLERIESFAFSQCNSLQSVILPNTITYVGSGLFDECNNINHFEFPMEKVEYIGADAFYNCPCPEIHLPHTLTEIGNNFINLSKLKTLYIDCDVEMSLHAPASELETVVIGEHKTRTNVFYHDMIHGFPNCPSLKEVILGKSVETIDDYAFKGTSITAIKMPKSIKTVGRGAFQDCNQLAEVEIEDIAAWCSIDFDVIKSNPLTSAHVLKMNGAEITDLVIPEGVTTINSNCFEGASNLVSLTLPSSVKTIRLFSFKDCNKLTKIHLSDLAAWCGNQRGAGNGRVFSAKELHLYMDGKEIVDLVIPDEVKDIAYWAFSDCSGLKSVKIHGEIKKLKDETFSGCTGLTTIDIQEGVESIGGNTFYGCTGLTSINLPNSVWKIDIGAFEGCTSLTSVSLGKNIWSIGDCAFKDCPNLTAVKVYNKTPREIQSSSFPNCRNATLYVRKGCKTTYESADYWKDFKEIIEFSMPTYKLTYIIDGEEYMTYYLEEDDDIAPITPPTKEGYTFSGWSDIPETMPAHDVTITGTFTLDTGIEQIMSDDSGNALIFTIDGKRTTTPKRGINIIQMSDGTTKKVVVK